MTIVLDRDSAPAEDDISKQPGAQAPEKMDQSDAGSTKKPSDDFVVTAREAARYACEDKFRSWASVLPTVFITIALQVALFVNPFTWVSPFLSVALAIMLVRVFIFFHDVQHKALFRHSRLGRWMLQPFTIYYVYPPWVWRERHNIHHKRNCQIDDPSVDGQVPLFSTVAWAKMGKGERFIYRLVRSWTGMILGWIPYFLFPVLQASRGNPLAMLWPLAQIAVVVCSGIFLGWAVTWWALIMPIWIAVFMGTALFFVQHNAPGLHFKMPNEWNYGHAALRSSSYLDLPRWQHWLTGNIGYHHIHHINDRIPFYKLPEVMAAIPALQNPVSLRLTAGDLHRCLKLQLWCPDRGRLITLKEFKEPSPEAMPVGAEPSLA